MSKKLNLLALPKQADFMRCFVSAPGTSLIQGDIKSLEPHVLAHFSQDKALMNIYGPDAHPSHDVYLAAGLKIPGIGEEIALLYDFNNPDATRIKEAKSKFKVLRSEKLKPAYLGFLYGLGAETMHINLEISLAEARTILWGMERQFAGKGILQKRLEGEWAKRGGWIINGRGRPLAVDFSKKKDLVNRLVQSTGHDVLMRILWHVNNYRKEHKIEMRPYVVDFHDETIWVCQDHEIARAKEAINYAFDRTNDELNWTVTIRHGGLNHGPDLTLRCED